MSIGVVTVIIYGSKKLNQLALYFWGLKEYTVDYYDAQNKGYHDSFRVQARSKRKAIALANDDNRVPKYVVRPFRAHVCRMPTDPHW